MPNASVPESELMKRALNITKFDVLNDPQEIIIDFRESRIVDMSAIEAVNKLTERYHKVGKKVYITNLSSSSHKLLIKADKMINLNLIDQE